MVQIPIYIPILRPILVPIPIPIPIPIWTQTNVDAGAYTDTDRDEEASNMLRVKQGADGMQCDELLMEWVIMNGLDSLYNTDRRVY